MAEAHERVRIVEGAQQTLASAVFVLGQRVEDTRDLVVDLGEKLDRLDEKLDAAAISRVEVAAALAVNTKALETRVAELEAVRTSFKTAGQWAVSKAGPIILALVAGSALSPALKAAVAAALAP